MQRRPRCSGDAEVSVDRTEDDEVVEATVTDRQPDARRSMGESLVAWVFTAIGLVLLVRMVLVAFRAAGMAIGWLSEGNLLERIDLNPLDMRPLSLAINLTIPAIVLTLFAISHRAQQRAGEADGER